MRTRQNADMLRSKIMSYEIGIAVFILIILICKVVRDKREFNNKIGEVNRVKNDK